MPASKAQQRAVAKYMKTNYDEIKIRVAKGEKEKIKAHAEARGESINGFVSRAIDEAMTRDAAVTGSEPGRPPVWAVAAVEPHPDYTMTVTFRSGEKRLYDMRPWIESEKYGRVYAPLKDIDFFMRAYVDGSAAWSDEIDIAPEELYDNGVPIDETAYGDTSKNGESENE